MNKIEMMDNVSPKVTKIIEFLEKLNRNKRTIAPIQDGVNWLLALSSGTLLWYLTNFQNFRIDDSITYKCATIIILILFSASASIFTIMRAIILLRELAMNSALDSIQSLPNKILLRNKDITESELESIFDEKYKEYIEFWAKGHNLLSKIPSLTKTGIGIYYAGLTMLIVQVIKYIIITF